MPNRSSPGRRREGFAVKELLLVLAAIAATLLGLKVMDPLSNEQRNAVLARDVVPLFRREVPVGDEFVCLVTVDAFSRPDSPHPPYYVSHVRFASRNPDPSGAFLLDITAAETQDWDRMAWDRMATCWTWTLMDTDAALEYLHEHGKIAVAAPELTEEDRMSALIDCLSSEVQEVTRLDESLWGCVPAPLRETGIVVNTGGMGLEYVHELQGFPLERLATAITSAARDNDWTAEDPMALLSANRIGNLALTTADEQAIAQAYVYRLRVFFSSDPTEN